MNLNLFELKQRCADVFNLSVLFSAQKDGRSGKPIIKTRTLCWAAVFQVILEIKSVKGLEEWMKSNPLAQKLLPDHKQSTPGSDSTILSAAKGWSIDNLQWMVNKVVLKLKELGHFTRKLVTGREVRVCALDGSCFGNHWMAVLSALGEKITAPLDIVRYSKKGKEIPAARKILKRLNRTPAKHFTHCVVDGLYSVKEFLNEVPETGLQWIVKTTQENLGVIKWAKNIFEACSTLKKLEEYNVELVEAGDLKRKIDYRVWLVKKVPWDEVDRTLSVAKVELTHRAGKKKGAEESFWIISTDEELNAVELRELALWRWGIENNLFRELNQTVGSKTKYIKNGAAKHTLMWLWMLGWTLFQWMRIEFDGIIQKEFPTIRVTKRWLTEMLKAYSYTKLADG